MSPGKKFLLGLIIAALSASITWLTYARRRTIIVAGAVITANADPRKQLPIARADVTAWDGVVTTRATTDASGLFSFKFRKRLLRGRRSIKLTFRRKGFEPKEMTVEISGNITVAELMPLAREKPAPPGPVKTISNVLVRYSVKAATELNVGSAVRSFEVANTGNTPCNGRPLCSPDGKWKAAQATVSLDAGASNEFRNIRSSCIAGPCPFTHIDTPNLDRPARIIQVTATTWSDTATFLVEAEVVHPMVSEAVRHSYPVIFGDALNFTLPPAAEGVSLQADENGQDIIFPLGPTLLMSWADCTVRSNPDQTRVYRCTLKPGYRWSKTTSS